MAHPVESNAAMLSFCTSGSPNQFPRPTYHPGSDMLDCPPASVSPALMTLPSMPSTIPNSHSSRTARLMSTPRIKSKLSILSYDSSDMETSDPESPSSCESSDDELEFSARKSPPRKPTISRLSFPFVKSAKSPPSKAVKPIIPPTPCVNSPPVSSPASLSKTLLPSPPTTSSPFSRQPHHNPQRHDYRHRGYSRHALAHIKWFWATREEDWEVKNGPVRLNKPRLDESFIETALDDPLASILDSSGHKRKMPLHPVHQSQHELPPMTIHPRRGDLTTLRDPYCIEIDRTFVGLPTWTIGKTLWMYDVHLASQDRPRVDVESNDVSDLYDDTESESESMDMSASSVGFSDDSDATLVDSETESELSPGGSSSIGVTQDQGTSEKHFSFSRDSYSSPSLPIHRGPTRALSDTSLVLPSLHKTSWSRSAYSEPSTPTTASSSGKLYPSRSSWDVDWYRRWQCMIEISHRQRPTDGQRKFFIGQDA